MNTYALSDELLQCFCARMSRCKAMKFCYKVCFYQGLYFVERGAFSGGDLLPKSILYYVLNSVASGLEVSEMQDNFEGMTNSDSVDFLWAHQGGVALDLSVYEDGSVLYEWQDARGAWASASVVTPQDLDMAASIPEHAALPYYVLTQLEKGTTPLFCS